MIHRIAIVAIGLLMSGGACGQPGSQPAAGPPVATSRPLAAEIPVVLLPLEGPLKAAGSEVSAMAWRGDDLILVPETLGLAQDADRTLIPGDQFVYALRRSDVVAAVDATTQVPLSPTPVPVVPSLAALGAEFDGFEAVAFVGDTAYFQLETYQNADGSNPSIVLKGTLAPDLSQLTLDLDGMRRFVRPTTDKNTSHEAMLVWKEAIYCIYELNSAEAPTAARFDLALRPMGHVRFPRLDYRITDVTAADEAGRVWAINYRFPGSRDSTDPAEESLCARWGRGKSHLQYGQVERLVELQLRPSGFALTEAPPIQLELPAAWEEGGARNWEGIVRLPGRGFLLVTDKHPRPHTQFGFVPFPAGAAAGR